MSARAQTIVLVAWRIGAALSRLGHALSRVGLACAVVLLLLGHLLVLTLPHNHDVGVWAYAGWRLLAGDLPYRDFFDHKPPGVFGLFALGQLTGYGVMAVRLFDLFGALVATWYVRRIALALTSTPSESVANAIALLFAALVAAPQLSRGYAQTETLSLAFIIPAYYIVATAVAGTRSASAKRALIGGFIAGFALAIRVTAILDIALMAAALVIARGRGNRLASPVLFLTGAALPGGAYYLFASFTGTLPAAIDALWTFNRVYTASYGPDPVGTGIAATLDLLPLAAGLVVTGVLGLLGVFSRTRTFFFVLLWTAVAAVELAAPLRFYPHHFVYVIAPLALLGAWVRPRALGGIVGVVLLVACATTLVTAALQLAAVVPLAEQRYLGTLVTTQERVAALVREKTEPSATVLVWGVEPDVLYLAGRRSASRYIYTDVIRFPGGAERHAEILRAIDREAPGAIVLAADDELGAPTLTNELCARLADYRRASDGQIDGWFVYAASGDKTLAGDAAAGSVRCVPASDLVR